jgi:hypothetical protein
MKKLHVIHIPKCGGLSLKLLSPILDSHDIANHTATQNVNWGHVSDYSFVSWHFGVTFIDQPDTEFACILRDPADRAISNFLWLYRNAAFGRIDAYSSLETMLDKLKFYLFDDEFYTPHKNVQTKFLSNKVDDAYFESIYLSDGLGTSYTDELDDPRAFRNRTKDWYLEDINTSVETAKANLDKCSVIGIVDDHAKFLDDLFSWISTNWELDLQEEFNKAVEAGKSPDAPYYNYSMVRDMYTSEVTTTQSLKALLTQEEIDRIYADNSLDVELYEYAKAKLQ